MREKTLLQPPEFLKKHLETSVGKMPKWTFNEGKYSSKHRDDPQFCGTESKGMGITTYAGQSTRPKKREFGSLFEKGEGRKLLRPGNILGGIVERKGEHAEDSFRISSSLCTQRERNQSRRSITRSIVAPSFPSVISNLSERRVKDKIKVQVKPMFITTSAFFIVTPSCFAIFSPVEVEITYEPDFF